MLSSNSIRSRLTLASLLLLPLICGALAWSLERAFSVSLLENQQRQMTLQAYALMASAELQQNNLWLPELMSDDRLNQISSDSFAVVLDNNLSISWRSLSASDKPVDITHALSKIKTGVSAFKQTSINHEEAFVFQYAVEWESDEGIGLPFQFVIYENQADYRGQVQKYRHTLWLWLFAIGLSLIFAQLIVLRWGLAPLNDLIKDIAAVRQGNTERLKETYPKELTAVTSSINQLLEHEESQRARYRNTMADLAHSIKNPVAIIASELSSASRNNQLPKPVLEELSQQNERINQIVSYQLNRAVGGAAAPFVKAISINPVAKEIIAALQKVYIDKNLSISIDISESAVFKGDKGDLMELLGNLLDNAFKYGQEAISITAKGGVANGKDGTENQHLSIVIEDGGPGLSEEQQTQLIHRGERADTAMPGQGIGLAVVSDIVKTYQGELSLDRATLGGLRVTLVFAWNS